jgi:branched-chain amino acid transport system permease protein
LTTIVQILLNSFVSGFLLSLVAAGFTYIFRVSGVFHLAHGGIYLAGAFACWWIMLKTGNWFIAIAFSVIIAAIITFVIEKTVYLPLTKKQSNQSISLIDQIKIKLVL